MADAASFVVSIDIGSTKIAILIAEDKNDILQLIGHGIGDSLGVEKGEVIEPDLLVSVIRQVMQQAGKSAKVNLNNSYVMVNLSDSNLVTSNRKGQTPISAKFVSKEDVILAKKIAAAIPTSVNEELLHQSINRFTIDEELVVDRPIDMEAKVLEADMHLVVVSKQNIRHIEKSIDDSNLGIAHIVLDSMASSEAYLIEQEKENGVCLIDIGGGMTNISVFIKGGITYSQVFQVAGMDITHRIAYAYDTTFAEAERLKIEYGKAQSRSITQDAFIGFDQIKSKSHYLSHQTLVKVIEEGYLELFSLIKTQLQNQDLDQHLKSGFVLIGGGCKIDGCSDLARDFFSRRAKIGVTNIEKIKGKEIVISDPIYGSALGLLLYNPREWYLESSKTKTTKGFVGKMKNILGGF